MNQSTIQKVNFIADKLYDRFEYLYSRWQDEKEYEKFDEYVSVARSYLEELGGTFVSMTKRPFKMTFTVDNHRFAVVINSKTYSLMQC